MTSTVLASRKDSAPVIALGRARSYQTPTTVDAKSILADLQSGTGRVQVFRKAKQVPNGNLLSHWEIAMAAVPTKGWRLLAEDLFEVVEDGEVQLTATDNHFLIRMAADPEAPPYAANTAIRLMGMLAEEDLIARAPVICTLKDLLVHDDTQRRYYAVKALWQARATDALPALRRRADRESSDEVMSILQRAIAVLK